MKQPLTPPTPDQLREQVAGFDSVFVPTVRPCDEESCSAGEHARDDKQVTYQCAHCGQIWNEPVSDVNE